MPYNDASTWQQKQKKDKDKEEEEEDYKKRIEAEKMTASEGGRDSRKEGSDTLHYQIMQIG